MISDARIPKLYLLWAEGQTYFKVGYTSCPVKERIGAFLTGSPFNIHILSVVEGYESDERQIHRQLAPIQTRGEWFDCALALSRDVDLEPFLARFIPGVDHAVLAKIMPSFTEWLTHQAWIGRSYPQMVEAMRTIERASRTFAKHELVGQLLAESQSKLAEAQSKHAEAQSKHAEAQSKYADLDAQLAAMSGPGGGGGPGSHHRRPAPTC
jgi:hypothetical protein